ncbi:MAG: hypothetical protein ABSH32_29310 [Bryobacteraceae bacterium]|jgi:hypothetical protein
MGRGERRAIENERAFRRSLNLRFPLAPAELLCSIVNTKRRDRRFDLGKTRKAVRRQLAFVQHPSKLATPCRSNSTEGARRRKTIAAQPA